MKKDSAIMTKIEKIKPLLIQVLIFGVVGVITLGIDIGVSTLLYAVFRLPAYLASGAGFLSGFFFNFPMNRKKVFYHSEADRFSFRIQVLFYVILCILNLVVTSLLVDLMVNTGSLLIQYAKIVVTIMIAIWNFILFKTFIFSKNK